MKNLQFRRLLSALLILSLLLMTGCGGGGTSSAAPDDGESGVSSESTGSATTSDATGTDSTNATGSTQGDVGGNTTAVGGQAATTATASKNTATQAVTTNTTKGSASNDSSTIDYTEGTKPAKRATTINGFVRRAGKYLIDEAGDEWYVKGGGIDNGSLAGKFDSNETFCNESLYKAHADLGCNTIRLTFNWEIFVKNRTASQFRESGFQWLKQQVEWAKKYNMRLILNMHRIPCGDAATGNVHNAYIFWNKTYQQQWKAVWREIARRFADEPVILAYSMWNEQNAPYMDEGQDASEQVYGDLYQECIDVIRTVDKKHMIVCEQVYNRESQDGAITPVSLPAFPPLREQNIMYEYHNYYPYDYTYQNSNGNGAFIVYGTTANYDTIWANHKPFARYRDDMNVPVFCGEWGAYYDTYREGTNSEKWADDMMKVLKDLEMQFTIHTPFAMYSKALQPWHYTSGTPTWGGPEYTILEDAFKRHMPTM